MRTKRDSGKPRLQRVKWYQKAGERMRAGVGVYGKVGGGGWAGEGGVQCVRQDLKVGYLKVGVCMRVVWVRTHALVG